MVDVTTLISPILFVFLLVTAINRVGVFWQKERSWQVFYAFLTYACFCLLYLAAWWQWPTLWRDAIRFVLLLALVFGNYYEWRELFAFLRKKEDDAALPHVDAHVTLRDLGEPGNAAALEACEKSATNEKESE